MKDLKNLNLITSEKKFKDFIKNNDNYRNSLNQQNSNNFGSSDRKNSESTNNLNDPKDKDKDKDKKLFRDKNNDNFDERNLLENSSNTKLNTNMTFYKSNNNTTNENNSKMNNLSTNSINNTKTIQSYSSINNERNQININNNHSNKIKFITGISIVKSNINNVDGSKTQTQDLSRKINDENNVFSLASLEENRTIESKKRSVSECSGNLKNNLSKENFNDEDLLINDENGKLVDKYLLKQGIKNKVDFNNNFSKLKIYKKILEETNRFLKSNDEDKNIVYNLKRVNLSESEILSKSNTNSKTLLNTKGSEILSENSCNLNNLNELNQNIKLIDLSNKFIVLHQENSELKSKLKEKDNEIQFFNKQNKDLSKEIESLKSKLEKVSNLNGINNIYENNDNINSNRFNFTNDGRVTKSSSLNYQIQNNLIDNNRGFMSQDCNDYIDELNSKISSLTLENEKLCEFKNNIMENSKTSDLLNMSIIESMKNANLIIDHFNLSGIRSDDNKMKKLVEEYISKYF